MRLSIVISVYQSYEIVRRQLLHLNRICDPKEVEVIIVDDGSDPPIPGATIQTGNKLAWTQGLGRNAGASIATGDYLFFTDIDHIISKKALEDALLFTGKKMIFRRQIAILDEEGYVCQDPEVLKDWGWKGDKLDASVHGNTFVMRRDIFEELGGYTPRYSQRGYYAPHKQGDDCHFNTKWNHWNFDRGDVPQSVGRDIYMFPVGRWHKSGDLNPKGLFHNLDREKQEKFNK